MFIGVPLWDGARALAAAEALVSATRCNCAEITVVHNCVRSSPAMEGIHLGNDGCVAITLAVAAALVSTISSLILQKKNH